MIRDLFLSDVTRDIPPVVYFHEQSPDKVAAEVSEYIITGGWPDGHPNHRRVPNGIHEQYIHLLSGIVHELGKPGGPDLPNAWISGFYGSGKSSFAKLLGLALNGDALPNGMSVADAWLRRDTSPKASDLAKAWQALRQKVEPLAVIFDVGGVARDGEQVHSVAVRQLQKRLGYSTGDPLVAEFELRLERDGEWARFETVAANVLGAPWREMKDKQFPEDDFSRVMAVMFPARYPEPTSWFAGRVGTNSGPSSPEDAVNAIRDMLKFRQPRATVFFIIDEVSQYVLAHSDRLDRLRAFATALGTTLRGKAWLLALGQQKLDEEGGESFLNWAKDRFPPKLRVHLAATNIRDVVHKRLLQKKQAADTQLRKLFTDHRPSLQLYAYGCQAITPDEFVDVYPMLPGQIDLILQITSALRARSARAAGDDQAIRGLLQLLGELFRDQKLADQPVNALVTLDQVYEVQHTALDSEVQASMARLLGQCANDDVLMVRAAKAVALLELIQDTVPTDAKFVAQCLYDRVDRGNNVQAVSDALEELRRRNLLGYSEKQGYKIQSSAAEEWERERRDFPTAREATSELVQQGLKYLVGEPNRPKLEGRPFPWAARFSDGRQTDDAAMIDAREDAAVTVDFRFLPRDERTESAWVRRSAETTLHNRLVWVCGDTDTLETKTRELQKSAAMVRRYKPRRESLNAARRLLLHQEENRIEDLETQVRQAVAAAWLGGRMYFRGRSIAPQDMGASFTTALETLATRLLPDLFPHFVATQVQPAELLQLLDAELAGPSPKFLTGELGILDLDAGRYVPACSGIVPTRVWNYIQTEGGLGGKALLSHFGSPPYGYTPTVVKACVAGLLRAGRLKIQSEAGNAITAIRDAGVRDLFEKEGPFRQATIFPAGEDDIGFPARARICAFFQESLSTPLDREDHAIADAALHHFPLQAQKLRVVETKLSRLPVPRVPAVFPRLGEALEACLRNIRHTQPTVMLIKKHLDTLRDGVELLQAYDVELTDQIIGQVARAHDLLRFQAAQLRQMNVQATNVDAAATRVDAHVELERPWREIAGLEQDLEEIRAAYVSERGKLLQWQEQQTEEARARVRARQGYSTLTADQAHHVLRPLAEAVSNTDSEAVAPALVELRDPFILRLQRAEEQANDVLDGILSQGNSPLVTPLDLRLQNRELSSEADVEALVDEVRARLLEQIRAGRRVRLR